VHDTIDYGSVYRQVAQVVDGTTCKLLEHLATLIADTLLAEFPSCIEVRVRVGKPVLFPTTGRSGMPGIEITRSRDE
jgi:dihydroneopterin aldolase